MSEQLSFDLVVPADRLLQLWTPDEIYDRLSSENIERFVEDRRVERKSVKVQPKTLAEYLSMWSNTQPHGGLIFVGIDDDGQIAGCKSASHEHINSIESLTPLCEDARWSSKRVPVRNSRGQDDFILVYRVEFRSDKVVENSGGDAFIREGDKKLRMSEPLKRELRITRGEIHYELEPVPLKFPDDFEWEEVKKFCHAFFVNRRFKEEKSVQELLELAKLGKRTSVGFAPNLACALLFAKDPRSVTPGARIRLIKYEGTEERFGDELNAVYSTFIDGNISKLLVDARPLIAAQLRTFQTFTPGGRLAVHPEYPEEAWFEAIVNAVAHRSYNLKTQNIFVKIFDDRFVVESPGGFVPPTTGETVYDAHNPRNPFLMEAMMHLELTFCGFEGTRRMRRAMRDARLPEPMFKQIEALAHQVHVTLHNDVNVRRLLLANEAYKRIPEEVMASLSNDERAIMNFLSNNRAINITSAALIIGKSWPTAQKAINSLVEKGILEPTTDTKKRRVSTKSYRIKQGG